MPITRKSGAKWRRGRRRGAPRRHVKNRLRNRVPTGAAPVARKHVVKLKYSDVVTINVTGGLMTSHRFRLNSVFDPDLTGVGHQPYGFDQISALFLHYRVYKCTWHIQFAPSNDRLHCVVVPVNNDNTFGSISLAGEYPMAVSKVLAYSGGVPCRFKGSSYLPRLTGATSVQYKTDDRYSATVTTNPLEVMNLHACVYNPGLTNVATSFTVTLIYHTEFYDPVVLAQS